MIPMAPAVDINPADIPGSYPLLIIAGISIAPRAATVAGPDPEIAAKNTEVITATIAKPLFLCPTNFSAKLINLSDMPAFSMTFPASIKKGIANSVNLPIDAWICIGNMDKGMPPANIAAKLDSPKDIAIGTFKNNNMIKVPNNINDIDI